MNKKARMFYGMSGTFKATTIQAAIRDYPEIIPVWSMIKPWKMYEENLFKGMIDRNNINFAILHLCNYKHTVDNAKDNSTFYVERGITDMVFYETRGEIIKDDTWIIKAVDTEKHIVDKVEKTLLIQNDTEFIGNVVFKESTRKEMFSGIDQFLKNQEDYVEFTKKYNQIDEVIDIRNAKNYIRDLGLVYNEA